VWEGIVFLLHDYKMIANEFHVHAINTEGNANYEVCPLDGEDKVTEM
jgi:hypothetical protein